MLMHLGDGLDIIEIVKCSTVTAYFTYDGQTETQSKIDYRFSTICVLSL